MLAASLIVLLGICCTGSSSQPTVIQETSMSPSRGETVKLSCSLSSGEVKSYDQSWYQQKEGGPPRFLYYYYSSASAGSGDLSRFSASKENNQNKWYLTIRDVQEEDEANYYCGVWYGASNGLIFGRGTRVTIIGRPTVSPSVQVFAPSPEEIRSLNPHTVVCLLSNFYPPSFVLQWKCDDKVMTSGVETTKATKQGDKYLASSYLKLSASDYEKYGTFTCEVTHESKTIVKSVSKSGNC